MFEIVSGISQLSHSFMLRSIKCSDCVYDSSNFTFHSGRCIRTPIIHVVLLLFMSPKHRWHLCVFLSRFNALMSNKYLFSPPVIIAFRGARETDLSCCLDSNFKYNQSRVPGSPCPKRNCLFFKILCHFACCSLESNTFSLLALL